VILTAWSVRKMRNPFTAATRTHSSHATGDKRADNVAEDGWGQGAGGAAAIAGVLQGCGCGCLPFIRRVCNKKN